MENIGTEALIQGGIGGIAIACLVVLYKVSTLYFNHSTEVINRNTDAFVELTKSHQKLTDAIDRLLDKVGNEKA